MSNANKRIYYVKDFFGDFWSCIVLLVAMLMMQAPNWAILSLPMGLFIIFRRFSYYERKNRL
jgi:hypothetical protein